MSDEANETTSQPADATTVAAPAPDIEAIKAQYEAQIAASRAELDTYKQTLQAIQGQVGGQPQGMQVGQSQLPPQVVQALRGRGLKDEEITQAGALILPFLETYGAPIINELQATKLENQFLKASRNTKDYPHWAVLEEAGVIDAVRQQALQRGQLIDPKTAYEWARGVGYDKVKAAEASDTAATARARDAHAQGQFAPSARTAIDFGDKTIKSADDLLTMSDEEYTRFWDQHGNTPF